MLYVGGSPNVLVSLSVDPCGPGRCMWSVDQGTSLIGVGKCAEDDCKPVSADQRLQLPIQNSEATQSLMDGVGTERRCVASYAVVTVCMYLCSPPTGTLPH